MITKKIYSSYDLPLTFMYLNDWSIIYVYGSDSKKYLQSKVTIDMLKLNNKNHYLTAHCNAQGKILSILNLFYYKKGFAYLIRKNMVNYQVSELKKYSIFSKVKILNITTNMKLIGIAGLNSSKILSKIFKIIPNKNESLVIDNSILLLFFPCLIERFIIISNIKNINEIYQKLSIYATFNNDNNQWLILDIESGLPIIDFKIKEYFIPQSVNLHLLNAIDFRKGCYSGQEIIARTQYRGINKKALYCLTGYSNTEPNIGDNIEFKIKNNWIICGMITSYVKITSNQFCIQAVMKKNVYNDDVLRLVTNNKSSFKIKVLPYNLK